MTNDLASTLAAESDPRGSSAQARFDLIHAIFNKALSLPDAEREKHAVRHAGWMEVRVEVDCGAVKVEEVRLASVRRVAMAPDGHASHPPAGFGRRGMRSLAA